MAFSWQKHIEKSRKHNLYRCERLAKTHNPDYVNKHANEARELAKGLHTETNLRLEKEQLKRFKQYTPKNLLTDVRMNKQK